MDQTIKRAFREMRNRSPHYTARDALSAARRYVNVTLADYQAKLAPWNAQADKRRYAAGGSANRPKFPTVYSSRPDIVTFREAATAKEGWYADTIPEAIYTGQVWQLPSRKGALVYVAGYVETEAEHVTWCRNDNGSIETFDDVKDALRAGENLAERNAETEREYCEKWDAASMADNERNEARDALKDSRMKASGCIRALRQLKALDVNAENVRDGFAIVYDRLESSRDAMRASIEKIQEASATIADLNMKGEF